MIYELKTRLEAICSEYSIPVQACVRTDYALTVAFPIGVAKHVAEAVLHAAPEDFLVEEALQGFKAVLEMPPPAETEDVNGISITIQDFETGHIKRIVDIIESLIEAGTITPYLVPQVVIDKADEVMRQCGLTFDTDREYIHFIHFVKVWYCEPASGMFKRLTDLNDEIKFADYIGPAPKHDARLAALVKDRVRARHILSTVRDGGWIDHAREDSLKSIDTLLENKDMKPDGMYIFSITPESAEEMIDIFEFYRRITG